MSHTSGKIRKRQRSKAGHLRQTHLRTVILRTHPHRRKDRQGHHRNLSLDMQVNLCRSMIPVTPITTRIQTRAHTVPYSGSSTRCVFLVDTMSTRTRNATMSFVRSFTGFLFRQPSPSQSNVPVRFRSYIRGIKVLSRTIYLTPAYQAC